ncbi:DNA-binding transcriptional regulator, MarR family [Agromyces sp. CF514]|uniref:MarR family winged helix-turn-helix transcriptional regulator n=1 Tax=Agromyces sp. CF514 TaxID=1881031 RepID=UPI0008F29174|nr:MarR family transcriptional regulator [Agromyces sp. CF514]SFR70598.1 DNA-binding transcriptional regulator, MarR family [Agromyces sp. CF514]
MSPAEASDALDVARLSGLISPLRRSLLRAARAAEHLPDIPDAQIEVLRALPAGTSRSPVELADDLSLNRTTVSNLLKSMEAAGLVTRAPDVADRRRVEVRASTKAHRLLERFDAASAGFVGEAIADLDPADAVALASALPALERLRDALQDRSRAARGIRSATEAG